MLEPSRRYPEDVGRRLLARAIELDAAEPASISERELRSIAGEIGISQASLQLALQELEYEKSIDVYTPRRNLSLPFIVSGSGLTLGIAGALALQPRVAGLANGALPAIIFGVVEVASGTFVVYADDDDHLPFQRINAVLWTAVTMGIVGTFAALIDGEFAPRIATLLTWAFTGWVISSLLGGGAIALRARYRRVARPIV